ncbi:MAG TPA: M24 family metallopeptidase [Gaiella sp.]|nr:M24 family metallopeptidase [Gaiella sp.]
MAVKNSVGDRLQPVTDTVSLGDRLQPVTDTVSHSTELDRRLTNVRAAMAEHALDGLVVSGNEYSGFEGAVTYLSGFQIVHRYAYVVVPAEGDPLVVFPSEARYVGEHGTAQVEQRFDPFPGQAIADHAKDRGWRRIGVYGLDYVMTVRDYRALEAFEVVPFDVEFDHARAVKSEAELESVRDSVRINRRGFELFADAYEPGRSAAEVMAAAEEYFVAEGCGRLTMNMVLTAPGRSGLALPEFKIARRDEVLGDFVLPSLEIAGPGMHWVEVSRALAAPGTALSADTAAMAEAYVEYYEAAKTAMRPGATCHDVHVAVSKGFHERGYHLGHVTGHSIGMTMIEFPKIGEGVETELAENMVLSMHPHAIAANGEDCLYMQDTWLVTAAGGVPLADLPMEVVVAG